MDTSIVYYTTLNKIFNSAKFCLRHKKYSKYILSKKIGFGISLSNGILEKFYRISSMIL